MNSDKILTLLMLAVAIVAAFVEIPYTGLALLLLGLVAGIMNPIDDMLERTAYLLVAIAAPGVADNLDMIPAIGTYLNSIIDGVAIAVAGVWIANFTSGLISRVTADSTSEG